MQIQQWRSPPAGQATASETQPRADAAQRLGQPARAAPAGARTLTKRDIVERLSERIGFNNREAKEIVDLFLECVADALARGDSVRLSGFGVFHLRDKRERPGRNPSTGEPVQVSARRVVMFRAGQRLRERVGGFRSAPDAPAPGAGGEPEAR